MQKSIFILLAILSTFLAACAPQVTVTPQATVTLTPPPTATVLPTPTLHPQFIVLQDQIAAAGERFTLKPDGTVQDGATNIPGLQVGNDGKITITVNGEPVEIDPSIMNFDDENGLSIEGFEDTDGDGDWEAAKLTPKVATVLTTLDYDPADHESFNPKFYTIETREWQGQQVKMLIHDNPEVEGTRIDGMEVEINGELRWIRGLWYETSAYPGSGGIVLDMIVSPANELATYFAEENGPDSVYGQFLKAVARQRGIAESQIWDYIVRNDYKIKIRLPQRANGSGYSPSLLTESELVEVDFSQPFYRSNRAEVNLRQAVNGVILTDLPEQALFLFGDSRERSGWFVDAQGALNLIRFDYKRSMITGRAEHVSGALFNELEILAAMTDSFSDAGDFGPNQWLEKYLARVRANYRPGNTVLDRDLFAKYNDGFTDYTWSVFKRK